MRRRYVKYLTMILVCFMLIQLTLPVQAIEFLPTLEIVTSEIPEAQAGKEFTLPITLRNNSGYIAKQVAIIPILEDNSPFSIDQLILKETEDTITPKKTADMKFDFLVDKNAKTGTYPITLDITYQNSQGATFNQKETVYVKLTSQHIPIEIIVDSVTYSVDTPIAGQAFTMDIKLKNTGTLTAENIVVGLSSNESFMVTSNQSEQYILNMSAMAKKTVSYDITPKEELESGLYPIQCIVKYTDNFNELKTKEFELFIPISGEGYTGNVDLALENITIPEQVDVNNDFTVSFDVVNKGEGDAENLQLVVEPESDKIIPVSLNKQILGTLDAGERSTLTYTYRAVDGVETKNHPIKVNLTYTENKKELSINQYLGIYVQGKSSSSTSTVPLMIVSDYSSDPTIVNAGEEFTLDLTLWNTNNEKAVQNMKITLQVNEDSQDTQDDVFTPVDGSNTLYVSHLEPNAKTTQQLKFYTVPDAKARNYKIQVNFEYEYEQDGDLTKGTSSDQIGIQVVQPAEIQIVNFNTDSAPQFAGDRGYVYITCNNIGNVKVKNLQAKITGDIGEETIFVGDLESGASHEFKFRIRPNEIGTMNESITVSYKDTKGEEHEYTEEFTLEIMEPMPEPDMNDMYNEMGEMGDMEEQEGTKLPWIIGGIALGVVIIVIFLIVRKRRKKKELMFDEVL